MGRRLCQMLLLVSCTLAVGGGLCAGTIKVQVPLPVPEKIDMQGIDSILFTRLVLLNDNPDVDLNREALRILKSDFHKRTHLEILDVDPPPLPEQPLNELVKNRIFWREMGEKYDADLIVAGSLEYKISDRSGYTQDEFINPATGQRVRGTRYTDREGFSMSLRLYFLRGRDGELVYDDQFSEDSTMPGKSNDALSILHGMFENIEPDVLGIVASKMRKETRTLFTD